MVKNVPTPMVSKLDVSIPRGYPGPKEVVGVSIDTKGVYAGSEYPQIDFKWLQRLQSGPKRAQNAANYALAPSKSTPPAL